ncbi:alpha-L-rhamnosidase-related protein [Cohnella herbarum]|uniref:Alpha-L-rhamnosidase six-hairpin glycosidase domain-containing protein n=1 Tax=Cohnella herbarum TaxID=2728023 RepID=A0A7Z2VNY1_9BACL|nr:alpha-L-rhamnosidase C-terminal domain-containing protein [Cohnella herbarum]QJD86808.1 hypothetical protein HH215_28980 [Cohnella herbarum]
MREPVGLESEINKEYILTPSSKQIFAHAVHSTKGEVRDVDNIRSADGQTAKLMYPKGGEKPVILLDLGPSAPGGYPIFKVSAQTGSPVLRIAYADWYEWIVDPSHGENGDFSRGSATYLGVELPVPPANPYRYELYTIQNPGMYIAPMIQGQQRWVLIQLDTEDSSVEIEFFRLENVSDMSPYKGHFLCNDDDLNRLWYASTYTAQIASYPNVDAWTIVEGWLIPRRLAKSNDIGLSVQGEDWRDYSFHFDFVIRRNPGPVSAVGWVVRAKDENNGYVGQIDLDSRLHLYKRIEGVYVRLKPFVTLPVTLTDGVTYRLEIKLDGSRIETYLDGQLVDTTVDSTYSEGKVGFCQPLDKWALIRNVRVEDSGGATLFADDFSGDLSGWSYARTASFIADGAKRDRLPWLGDLDWAGRNVYYAFDNYGYMKDTIEMFAFHQTPEGYIWAACYPENQEKPGLGEYGYYQSDEFCAWFAPVLADYYLFTGDLEFANEMYPVVSKGLNYLWNYVESDGLFFQRYETSKGIWGHLLERTGKGAYVNFLVYDSFMEAAFLARQLGMDSDAADYSAKAAVIRKGINDYLWDDELRYYVDQKGSKHFSFYDNALALAIGFPDRQQAESIMSRLKETDMGKYQSLAIRGKFHYRHDEDAIGTIRKPGGNVDWIGALHDWRGPHATWECMVYPPPALPPGKNWGDSSHPDTAIAHLLSGYLLGIQPTEPGFRAYEAVPHACDLQWAEGSVPTPHGEIRFSWSRTDSEFSAALASPEGTIATLGIPKPASDSFIVYVNGKPFYRSNREASEADQALEIDEDDRYVYLRNLKPGSYEIACKSVANP